MTGYELSRRFFDWAFENRQEFKPTVSALYFYLVEVCNKLGWKNEFSISAKECMEGMGVSGYNTYKGAFDTLCKHGFIVIVKKSCNHHQANIISLSNFDKVTNKVDDRVTLEYQEGNYEGSGDIHKTNKPLSKPSKQLKYKVAFNFRESFIDLGVEPKVIDDWIKVRKTKRATNTETAFEQIRKEIDKSGKTPNECIKLAAAKSWQGFNAEWVTSENDFQKEKSCAKKEKGSTSSEPRNYDETF